MSTNGYPFMSRAAVLAKITAEPAFAVECVRIIEERGGFMASHRARAAKLISGLASGKPSTAQLQDAAELAARYSKTLARVFRERDLAARPEIAAAGAVFGVVAGAPSPAATTGAVPAPAIPARAPVVVAPKAKPATEAAAPADPAPKRRGRPPGSKNRPKDAPAPTKRRRRT